MDLVFQYLSELENEPSTESFLLLLPRDFVLEEQGLGNLAEHLKAQVQLSTESQYFQAKRNEHKTLPVRCGECRLLQLSGLGKIEELTTEHIRRITAKAIRSLIDNKVSSLTIVVPKLSEHSNLGYHLAEAVTLGSYDFKKYKSSEDEENVNLLSVQFVDPTGQSSEKEMQQGHWIGQSTNLTRDLGNTAPNDMTPKHLQEIAESISESSAQRIHCQVFDEEKMESLGMDMFLGVSKGSLEPGRMIFLEYAPENATQTIAFVGKGITFDTGGISLKPGKGMDEMKYDMCGAGAVLGTMKALSQMDLPVRVIGVVAAAENMPDGKAQKPGDIVKAYNGKTVEILNTDAEGRLVLGDALSYTVETYQPDYIVDLATLTGACIVALGHYAIGAITNSNELCQSVIAAGERTGDRVWQLPNFPEYGELIKGKHADLQNIGPAGDAGTITAGAFLEHFVNEVPWVHLDIAGTAWGVKGIDYHPANSATGTGVRLLLDLLQNLPEKKD